MHEGNEPATQTLQSSAVRDNWNAVLGRVNRSEIRVIVEENGNAVAAIIAPGDLERLNELAAEWDEPFEALDRSREAFRGIPHEELEREVSRGLEEARAQLRAEREQAARTA